MKSINSFFLKKHIVLSLIVVFLFNIIGCSYFKSKNILPEDIPNIKNIGKIHKYFVVHSGEKVFTIKDINVDEKNITGKIMHSDRHIYYYEGRAKRVASHEGNIMHEVHIYLMPGVDIDTDTTEIPLTLVNEVKVIDRDSGAQVASFILGTIGVGLGAFIVITIVVLLLKTSCPYIYVSDGENFVFEGETYGGAIAKNLERDDFMPLPSIKIDKNAYRVRISNELKERQYTDLAELMVINHESNQKVLLDKNGKPRLLGNLKDPKTVKSYNGDDLKNVLNQKDHDIFMFNNTEHSKNGIIMNFEKPMHSQTAKLVLNGKNTLWFDYLFGEFIEKFGGNYNSWMEKQSKVPSADRIKKMRDSDFPLSIYVKNGNEWQFVDYLHTIGPLASRDFVIPIDISSIPGTEVEIKIETGFMFWEVDQVGMDFTSDQELEVNTIKPSQAVGTGSMDWTKILSESDENYMIQDNIGEFTDIIYETVPHSKDELQTVFLHTRGYYELIREYEGFPKIIELNKFKKPGYFSDWSRANYLQFYNREEEIPVFSINK